MHYVRWKHHGDPHWVRPARDPICSIDECSRPTESRGWCNGHYQRWAKHGDPLGGRRAQAATCTIDGCEDATFARDWCQPHYRNWRIYGNPLTFKRILNNDRARLMMYIDVRSEGECWPWTGFIGTHGYGASSKSSKGTTSHRLVYQTFVGPIPEGYEIDHLCHIADDCTLAEECPHRRCNNPAHMMAVPPRVNNMRTNSAAAVNARKTHCIRGHEFNEENTRRSADGTRNCRACERVASKRQSVRSRTT